MRGRREALKRLLDVLQPIQAIDVFTSGKTLEAFLDCELLRAAVVASDAQRSLLKCTAGM